MQGINYYRVKIIENNGSFSYTNTAKVNVRNRSNQIVVYPNPSVGKNIGLQMEGLETGVYAIKILYNSGQLLFENQLNHLTSNNYELVKLNNELPKGIYLLEIISPANSKQVIKLIR